MYPNNSPNPPNNQWVPPSDQSNFPGYPQMPQGSCGENQPGSHLNPVEQHPVPEGHMGGIPSSPWMGNGSGENVHPPSSGYGNGYPSAPTFNSTSSPFQTHTGSQATTGPPFQMGQHPQGDLPFQMGPQSQAGPPFQGGAHPQMGPLFQGGAHPQMGPPFQGGAHPQMGSQYPMGLPSYGLSPISGPMGPPPGANPVKAGLIGLPNPAAAPTTAVGYLPIHKKNKPPGMSDKEWKKEMKTQKKAAKLGQPVGCVSVGGLPVSQTTSKSKKG